MFKKKAKYVKRTKQNDPLCLKDNFCYCSGFVLEPGVNNEKIF
jgi:hypothetical protein